MQETNLVLFNLEEKLPLSLEIFSYYEKELSYLTRKCHDVFEVNESILKSTKSIILGKIENKKDLIDIIKILKKNRLKLKEGSLKAAVFNMVKNKKVEKLLSSYGCHEFLTMDMNLKTICFKIDFWARTLKDSNDFIPNKNKIERVFNSQKEDLGGFYKGRLKTKEVVLDDKNKKIQLGPKKELTTEELTHSGEILVIAKQIIDGEERTYRCQLEDLYDTELVVLFNKESAFELNPVSVDIILNYLNESVSLENIRGQIIEIENHNEEKLLAVIDLIEVPQMELKRLLKLYNKRQHAISEFMLRAKGY